jgi:hypothetical protein
LYQQVLGEHRWSTAASGTAGNTISFTRAMTLDASGNLGVGTTSPTLYTGFTTLDIDNATNGGLLNIKKNGTTVGYINGSSGMLVLAQLADLKLTSTGANTIQFSTNATERARITANGNLTIGGTTESARVRVEGTTNLTTALQLFRSGNSCGAIWQEGGAMRFGSDASTGFTEKMRVDSTTTAGQTALLLWDVDNNTLERVTVGAADSGGTGFKVLRIPN